MEEVICYYCRHKGISLECLIEAIIMVSRKKGVSPEEVETAFAKALTEQPIARLHYEVRPKTPPYPNYEGQR